MRRSHIESNGLISSSSQPSKSEILRVARLAPMLKEMDAICASATRMGRPAFGPAWWRLRHASLRDHPLLRLTRHVGDRYEVGVVVQHSQVIGFCTRGHKKIRERYRAMKGTARQDGLHFERSFHYFFSNRNPRHPSKRECEFGVRAWAHGAVEKLEFDNSTGCDPSCQQERLNDRSHFWASTSSCERAGVSQIGGHA